MAKTKKTTDLLGFLEKIDFPLLRKQKTCLIEVYEGLDEEERNALAGIHSLLDDLQDAADALGLSAYGESKNENCLQGIKCPDCGNEDRFHIAVLSFTDVSDDGTGSEVCDTEWDGRSAIECSECHLLGKVWQFQA